MYVFREIQMMTVRLMLHATCHYETRVTCLSEGGVPTLPPFLACLFCPKKWAG